MRLFGRFVCQEVFQEVVVPSEMLSLGAVVLTFLPHNLLECGVVSLIAT